MKREFIAAHLAAAGVFIFITVELVLFDYLAWLIPVFILCMAYSMCALRLIIVIEEGKKYLKSKNYKGNQYINWYTLLIVPIWCTGAAAFAFWGYDPFVIMRYKSMLFLIGLIIPPAAALMVWWLYDRQ